ncbi:hypothetical protein U4W20_22480 [Escherichia coli]|nr:hypothetical protein [Escherichia coli]
MRGTNKVTGLRNDASARARDKEGIVFVRTGREAGVLIIAELFSEVVTVSQPVPGEQETDITDGIRLSDWYYKYKKSSESNGKRQRSTVLTLIYW